MTKGEKPMKRASLLVLLLWCGLVSAFATTPAINSGGVVESAGGPLTANSMWSIYGTDLTTFGGSAVVINDGSGPITYDSSNDPTNWFESNLQINFFMSYSRFSTSGNLDVCYRFGTQACSNIVSVSW